MFKCLRRKRIIGTEIRVKIKSWIDHEYVEVLAKVDTGAESSSISKELADKLGKIKTIEKFEKIIDSEKEDVMKRIPMIKNIKKIKNSNGISKRAYVDADIIIKDMKIKTHINISDRKNLKYQFLLGKKDLKGFLINPDLDLK